MHSISGQQILRVLDPACAPDVKDARTQTLLTPVYTGRMMKVKVKVPVPAAVGAATSPANTDSYGQATGSTGLPANDFEMATLWTICFRR